VSDPRKLQHAFSIQHEYLTSIWKTVKEGDLEALGGRNKILGQLMLEHPQYQYFWELPSALAYVKAKEAIEEQSAVNADSHIVAEASVLEQIETKDPPEANKAYAALLRTGMQPHEARHAIARILAEVVLEVSHMAQGGQEPDNEMYVRKLRRTAKHPWEEYNEQISKIEECW